MCYFVSQCCNCFCFSFAQRVFLLFCREAWDKLGQMEKEEAMLLYVDELKKVSAHVKETCYPPEVRPAKPPHPQIAYIPVKAVANPFPHFRLSLP